MGMGKGMKMYLMANGGRREDARNNDERRMPKTYNMDGTYNVSVNGGGNRSEGGNMYTGGNNRKERQPDRMEYTHADPMARYRGKDGRYHAGTRRSEYGGKEEMRMGAYDRSGDEMRIGDDEEEKEYKVKISPESYRHMPPYMPRDEYSTNAYSAERESNYGADGRRRQIGFGASMMGDYEEERGPMQRGMSEYAPMEFDRQTAEKWVKSMKNEDKAHPTGGKWSAEMLKPLAQKFGVPTEGKEFWEFYAMTNAMYSDYSEIFKKHGLTSPELYAQLAKAFICDKDAVPEKVGLYYEFLVKKDD